MQPRQDPASPTTYIPSNIVASGFASPLLYPFRILQTIAPEHKTILSSLSATQYKLQHWEWKPFGVHIVRCGGVLMLQTSAKNHVQNYFDGTGPRAAFGGIFAAAAVGATWASFVETWFIRLLASQTYSLNLKPYRFNLPLLLNYFSREFFYSTAVFGSKDLSLPYWSCSMLTAGVVTAINQKIISHECTYDFVEMKFPGKNMYPNYSRDGVLQSLRNVAQGGIYQHSAYEAFYKNPVNNKQLLCNVILTYAAYPAISARIIYMATSALLLKLGECFTPSVNQSIGFFARKLSKPLTNEKQENHTLQHIKP